MPDPEPERIMELLMAEWLLIARLYPGAVLHVVSLDDRGNVLETTWADFDRNRKHHRATIGRTMSLDFARQYVRYE